MPEPSHSPGPIDSNGPMDPPAPLYPEVHVWVRSARALALISAVRYALRRAGAAPEQIARFSAEALSAPSERRQRRICARWVDVLG